jgi:hypothetical protein
LEIFVNGLRVDALDIHFPATPNGMSTKGFTSMMFGARPRPETDKRAKPEKSW